MHECLTVVQMGLCAHACSQWHPLVKDVFSTSGALCNRCAILPTQWVTFKLHSRQSYSVQSHEFTSERLIGVKTCNPTARTL